MPEEPKVIPYESDEAAHLETVTGWVSSRRGFYGDNEHLARWDGCTDMKCKTEGCNNRVKKNSYTICESCQKIKSDEKWEKMEGKEWDGVSPICDYDGDHYYFDGVDEVDDEAAYCGIENYRTMRLVHCKQIKPPTFDMMDTLCDSLGDDGDLDCTDINKIVNDWLEEHKGELAWEATNVKVIFSNPEVVEMDWARAIEHLDEMEEAYKTVPAGAGMFGLGLIHGLRRQYDAGERTYPLYREILEIE